MSAMADLANRLEIEDLKDNLRAVQSVDRHLLFTRGGASWDATRLLL